MRFWLLCLVCFVVLCITLTLGLWPFHSPQNEVTWLKHTNGLAFGEYGTVLGSDNLKQLSSEEDKRGSIEIWVQPDRPDSATILTLYRPENGVRFTLRQSLNDLELRAEVKSPGKAIDTHFFVNDAFGLAFRQKKPVNVAITSGQQGTMLYLDGVLVKVSSGFRVPVGAFNGRFILGDSPAQTDSFQGKICGLAVYNAELNGAQVLRHYRTWTQNGWPEIVQDEGIMALYLFDERTGHTIRSRAGTRGDLYIPATYQVVDKIRLEPFWSEFSFSRGYWSGNLKNIVGFIPLGFCFCAYFRIAHALKRAALVTAVLGFLVSLTIEILQAFLPTRDSGTTDLITNTIGTWLGVLCYQSAFPVLAEMFPWLSVVLASRPQATPVGY